MHQQAWISGSALHGPQGPQTPDTTAWSQGQMHTRKEEAEVFCQYFSTKFTSKDDWSYQSATTNHLACDDGEEVGINAVQLEQLRKGPYVSRKAGQMFTLSSFKNLASPARSQGITDLSDYRIRWANLCLDMFLNPIFPTSTIRPVPSPSMAISLAEALLMPFVGFLNTVQRCAKHVVVMDTRS